jgi:hypothetical protein
MLKSALAAILVLGTASVALADGISDPSADSARSYGPIVRSLYSQPAALGQSSMPRKSDNWMERASQPEGVGN